METKSKKILKLLSELSQDPKIKTAIDQLKEKYKPNAEAKIDSLKDMAFLALKLGTKFVNRRRARVIEDTLEALGILVQISFLIKANIFDKPVVQVFFKDLWTGVQSNGMAVYGSGKAFVDQQLYKRKMKTAKDIKVKEVDPHKDES